MSGRAVWFDFAGVLTSPVEETLTHFCATHGISPEAFLRAAATVANVCGTEDPMAPLDTPILCDREWQRRIESALWTQAGVRVDLDDFAASWFADRGPNAEMVAFARELGRRGFFIGMLSNMAPSFEPHWRKIVPAELFDDLVFSYRVQARKPEPRIYEIAAARAGRPGASCLLVDDLSQNCDGARAAGWSAVLFSASRQAIGEVESLLSC